MLIYAAAVTLVISLVGWIAYAVVAFFVLAPFVAGFGLVERTADIVFGVVLLPLPVFLSIWVFRRVTAVERRRAATKSDNPRKAAEVPAPDSATDAP